MVPMETFVFMLCSVQKQTKTKQKTDKNQKVLQFFQTTVTTLVKSAFPAALVGPDVHMGKGLVPAYAAVIAQQLLGIVGHAVGADALHPDVSRQAVTVLAGGAAAADGLVVTDGPVAGIDVHRLAEMHPDICEDVRQRLADKHRVGAVVTGELPHLEMRRDQPPALCGQTVHFYVIHQFSSLSLYLASSCVMRCSWSFSWLYWRWSVSLSSSSVSL